MYHALPREWLLATIKVQTVFESGTETVSLQGSGFMVNAGGDGLIALATNRHVVDLEYNDPDYIGRGFKLARIVLTSFMGVERYVTHIAESDISWHVHSTVDIALLRNVQAIGHAGLFTPASIEVIGTEDYLRNDLYWGDQVSFSSFQAWANSETQHPILRTGIVSNDPV